MGDLGYRDDQGRLWFCGRKSHRVILPDETLFTIPCEAIFNTHPDGRADGPGRRASERGEVDAGDLRRAGSAVDRDRNSTRVRQRAARARRGVSPHLEDPDDPVSPSFPVDIRHNAKIFREKLAVWAARRLSMRPADLGQVLVTGGGGFLGTALIKLLRGARAGGPQPGPAALPSSCRSSRSSKSRATSPTRRRSRRAVEGCQTVFHTAAKAGIWGPEHEYRADQRRGDAQRDRGLPGARRRGGSSTPARPASSSTAGTWRAPTNRSPIRRDSRPPIPRPRPAPSSSSSRPTRPSLATVSLRPHLIWGPGDNNLLPRIIARARRGQLRRIGRRDPLIDPIYIDNAAEAHLLAADRLEPGSPIAGKAYFVTQGETIPLWDMINHFLKAAGLAPVRRSISRPLAFAAAGLLETGLRACHGERREPPMTRFLARQLSTTHWFNIDAARRDLGYEPRVSIAEGLRRLERWLQREQTV